MTNTLTFDDSNGSSVERLSFALFQEQLRHVARFVTAATTVNPLDAVLKAIHNNPAMSQARLLTRILAAYIGRQVSFRSAEVSAFDKEHLALLLALMDSHDAGTLPATEWQRAADEAEAAQRDIGG